VELRDTESAIALPVAKLGEEVRRCFAGYVEVAETKYVNERWCYSLRWQVWLEQE